ncbi:MAG: MFS transporter [Coriobacteriales bacterium]|jgi:MFS family permease|nr:MFS transporter [Coriobacteriales bacterium]
MENIAKPVKQAAYGWIVLLVVYLSGLTPGANMAKVTALAPVVANVYHYDVGITGLVVALFFLLGFLLAFPGAGLVKKFGLRGVITAMVICGAIGSFLGAMFVDFNIFLISRVFEGAAFGIMGVAGPSAIAPWFPKTKRGLPLGIWATWVALAMCVCPIIYGAVSDANGILNPMEASYEISLLTVQQVWWGNFIFDIVVVILFNVLYRDAKVNLYGEDTSEDAKGYDTKIDWKGIFTNPLLIALALIFLVDELAFMAINGLFTTYLTGGGGVEAPITLNMLDATLLASAAAILGALMAPLFGWLTDLLKTKKWVLFAGLIGGVLFTATVFTNILGATNESIWPFYIIVVFGGIAGGGVPSVIWGSIPDTVKPDQIPSANATVACSQNLGMLIGAVAMGNAVMSLGWAQASWLVLVPSYIICIVILFIGLRKLK